MNAMPAKVAGVDRIVMVAPAPQGEITPLVLAAAKLAGVDEIYRIGGAQAIAALAYGTKTIPPVVKIVGPGNAYVAAAKRRVFGAVGIDMIAGPSEVLIIADKTANPEWIAADLACASGARRRSPIHPDHGRRRARRRRRIVAVARQLASLPRQAISPPPAGATLARSFLYLILAKAFR